MLEVGDREPDVYVGAERERRGAGDPGLDVGVVEDDDAATLVVVVDDHARERFAEPGPQLAGLDKVQDGALVRWE